MGAVTQSSRPILGLYGRPSRTTAGVQRAAETLQEAEMDRSDGPLEQVAAAFRDFLRALRLDLGDPNLVGTEFRVARAYRELFAGLEPGAEPNLRTFPNTEGYAGIVAVDEIPFYSLCAHHFLPFFGSARVGYLPRERLVGLSKLSRVVDHFARRPQLQERMTEQIAELLDRRLSPAGVIVVVRARHLCMEMRGVGKAGVVTTTVATRGAFADQGLQQQFLTGPAVNHTSSGVTDI